MKKNCIVLTSFLIFLVLKGFSQNPILKGFADPALRVHNGIMYMLVGKDKDPSSKDFIMPYWALYSTTDLRNWKQESIIDPKDNYLGAGYNYCWAGDLAFKNGKVYVYFSEHSSASGVVVADQPSGPFIDVLKKSLLPKEMSINFEYDPTVFTDDDGISYLIFGRDGRFGSTLLHFQIVKLNEDMISLAEAPHDLITSKPYGFEKFLLKKKKDEAGFDSVFFATDHQYFHKKNGIYYLSRDVAYESAKDIMGPFHNRRSTGNTNGHSSYSEYNGQDYHAWEFTCEPYGNRMYRQVMMTYLHYKDNGDMVDDPIFMQGGEHYETGVGSYSAKWDTIQSEWYFKKSSRAQKKESPNGGFEIQNLANDDYLVFPSVKDLEKNATINFYLSSETGKGRIEVHQDSIGGKILGSCIIPKTGSFKTYQTVPCKLKNKAGTNDLFFVFKGVENDLAHLDWIFF